MTQDKAVFVSVISLNFHSKNFSPLFWKLDLTEARPPQQDLVLTVTVTANPTSSSYFFDICCWKKTNHKTHKKKTHVFLDPWICCADTKSSHWTLLLPLLFYQVQNSGSSHPFLLQACFGLPFHLTPTFTLVNPAAFSPTLGTNHTNCLIQANPSQDARTLLFKPPHKTAPRGA